MDLAGIIKWRVTNKSPRRGGFKGQAPLSSVVSIRQALRAIRYSFDKDDRPAPPSRHTEHGPRRQGYAGSNQAVSDPLPGSISDGREGSDAVHTLASSASNAPGTNYLKPEIGRNFQPDRLTLADVSAGHKGSRAGKASRNACGTGPAPHAARPRIRESRRSRPPYPSARPTASSAVAIGTPACASLATTVSREHHVQSIGIEFEFNRRFQLHCQFMFAQLCERQHRSQMPPSHGLVL